jgi:ribonuclease P protein component
VFDRFRNEGRHVRVGPLWCTWIPDDTAAPPRVAFAVGRAVGTAVVRNRVRRRLRARIDAAAREARLAPGWYLIGATPAAAGAGAAALDVSVTQLLARIKN